MLLSELDTAALAGVAAARFRELVRQGFYPPPTGRDPKNPEWLAEEILAIIEARDKQRLDKMIASGLVAEASPAPTVRRIESEALKSPKAAGAIHLSLAQLGAQSYRCTTRDYRVWLPLSRHPDRKLARIAALHPQIVFAIVEPVRVPRE